MPYTSQSRLIGLGQKKLSNNNSQTDLRQANCSGYVFTFYQNEWKLFRWEHYSRLQQLESLDFQCIYEH